MTEEMSLRAFPTKQSETTQPWRSAAERSTVGNRRPEKRDRRRLEGRCGVRDDDEAEQI